MLRCGYKFTFPAEIIENANFFFSSCSRGKCINEQIIIILVQEGLRAGRTKVKLKARDTLLLRIIVILL